MRSRWIQEGKSTSTLGGIFTSRFIEFLFNTAKNLKRPLAAIFTLSTGYSYAIIVQNERILFYDSHHKTGDHSGSRLLIFNSAQDMSVFLLEELPQVPFCGSLVGPRTEFIKKSVISSDIEDAYRKAQRALVDYFASICADLFDLEEQMKALKFFEKACLEKEQE